jgi:hypothetical protein
MSGGLMTLKVTNTTLPGAETVAVKHGLNLGCGTVILPCPQPAHHQLIPADIYTDPMLRWHNVDRNAGAGVDRVIDLFDYPWRTQDPQDYHVSPSVGASVRIIPDNMYDVAIASHIVEHIPHYIVENGEFVPRHPVYQDGWFAWFAELWRVMKPGGEVHVLVPYAWSNSGMSDPTHTRYITPATLNYFNNATDDDPAFRYGMGPQRWSVDYNMLRLTPHELSLPHITGGTFSELKDWQNKVWMLGQEKVNMIETFAMTLRAVK